MKRQKNCYEKNKIWKIIAISGAVIFLMIIGLTAFKVARFGPRGSFQQVSEEQKENALSIIKEMSVNEGYSLEDYNINVDNKIMEIKVDAQKRQILRVALTGENDIKNYVIDINNWNVVQSSQTKYYGWMINLQKSFPENKERWLHDELMMKRGPPNGR